MQYFSPSRPGLCSRKRNFNPVKIWHRNGILILSVLAFGAVRMPFEAKLAEQLTTARLSPVTLAIGTRDKIGQTSSAVALGGLRTLVATFINLRAFSFFQEQRWDDLANSFDTIVDLAPRTSYYWETGSWHSAYNAASYYLNDTQLPALRRREAWRLAIANGRAFLERGVRNNPKDPGLLTALGFLLSDANKLQAFRDRNQTFAAAAAAYHRAADLDKVAPYVRRAELYSLARVLGQEPAALALAQSLYRQSQNRTPTLVILLLVLECHANPAIDSAQRAIQLFETPKKAYDALSTHWQRTRERFPVDGVASALESLEKTLNIPPPQSIFRRPLPPATGPDSWFAN